MQNPRESMGTDRETVVMNIDFRGFSTKCFCFFAIAGNVKKLTEFLEQGRLVNLDKFSVHTLASVLKKFLRKIPGGIFGPEVESSLLKAIQDESLPLDEKRDQIALIIRKSNTVRISPLHSNLHRDTRSAS